MNEILSALKENRFEYWWGPVPDERRVRVLFTFKNEKYGVFYEQVKTWLKSVGVEMSDYYSLGPKRIPGEKTLYEGYAHEYKQWRDTYEKLRELPNVKHDFQMTPHTYWFQYGPTTYDYSYMEIVFFMPKSHVLSRALNIPD